MAVFRTRLRGFGQAVLCMAVTAYLLPHVARAQNHGSVFFSNGGIRVNAPVRDATQPGEPLVEGPNWLAQLYFAPGTVSNPSLLTTNGISDAPQPFLVGFPGYFIGGVRRIDGYPDRPVTLQVRTWLATTGASWETATIRGESNLIGVQLAGDVPPPELFGLQPWSNYAVPEPSVGVLALCGLAAIALRKRR
jgi:hypothetical protein